MSSTTTTPNQRLPKAVSALYGIGLLLSLSIALPAYINSSFLSQFAPERFVGLIYAIASLLTIWAFSLLPHLLRRHGNFKITLVLLVLQFLSVIGLAFVGVSTAVFALFAISFITASILGFSLDIFLEHSSTNTLTGEIRGTYLVYGNVAWIISQVAASVLISDSEYWKIFLVAGLISIPVFLLVRKHLSRFTDAAYIDLSVFKALAEAWLHRDLLRIYIINFLLQFFYAWMVIYTPLYLHNHIGFSWKEIGIVFSIMLLPFVLTEIPLGKIADRWLGEKEMLVVGFVLMAATSALMSVLSTPSFLLWTALLFTSRIGASMVEVMSETYFFKQVRDKDVSFIGLFRTTRPWAYVIAPIVATVLFYFVELRYLFLVLALVMMYGAQKSLALTDTK